MIVTHGAGVKIKMVVTHGFVVKIKMVVVVTQGWPEDENCCHYNTGLA